MIFPRDVDEVEYVVRISALLFHAQMMIRLLGDMTMRHKETGADGTKTESRLERKRRIGKNTRSFDWTSVQRFKVPF